MLSETQKLPDDPILLRQSAEQLLDLAKSQAVRIAKLEHQLRGHQRARFGTKSENLDQLNLAIEDSEIVFAQASDPSSAVEESNDTKNKPKRKPLPKNLPRNDVELSPGETCQACGGDLRTLGEDITEELEYIPGRFIVNRITRPHKACSCCEAIVQEPLPTRPIERGRPGPGLLAHVLISKYGDSLAASVIGRVWSRVNVQRAGPCFCPWSGCRHKMRTVEGGRLLICTSCSWRQG